MSKNTFRKHVDLLLEEEKDKKAYVLITDFNTFIYDHILHHERKHFCHYCLRTFNTEKILKWHTNDCFKINGKQMIEISEKDEYFRIKNHERKKKILIHDLCSFESILVSEDNGKQNPEESHITKYQTHVACHYGNN